MRWIYKLENRFGRFRIPNLMKFIVAGMAIVFVVGMVMPQASSYLIMNAGLVLRGQVWRLLSFVFLPESSNPIWFLVSLYFYYFIGSQLEATWGSFRFTLYYILGILGSVLAAFIMYFTLGIGIAINTYLNLSLFLAFAALTPNATFMLFFILPLKAKWLAIASVLFSVLGVVQSFITGGLTAGMLQLVMLLVSLINFFLFLGPNLKRQIQDQAMYRRNRRNWHKNQ